MNRYEKAFKLGHYSERAEPFVCGARQQLEDYMFSPILPNEWTKPVPFDDPKWEPHFGFDSSNGNWEDNRIGYGGRLSVPAEFNEFGQVFDHMR